MKPRLSQLIFIGLAVIPLVALEGWFIWTAVIAVKARLEFQPYPQPYQAKVAGFDIHRGTKGSSRAPIVEVVLPQREKFRFNSTRYNDFNPFSLGESVELVSRPQRNLLGDPSEEFEINNAWHLWAGAALTPLTFPVLFIFVYFASRFDRRTRGRVWPVGRLQRRRR